MLNHAIDQLIAQTPLRSSRISATWRGDGLVAKVFPRPPGAAARLPFLDGVPPILALAPVDDPTIDRLQLPREPGIQWVLAVRPDVPGDTLLDVADGPDWQTRALAVALRLRDLHEVGIPHGDLQPANVIVDDSDRVHLIDVAPFESSPQDLGHVAGSAALMAPELWEGAPPSIHSDCYALACLVHWLASGIYPLRASGLAQWAAAHRSEQPVVHAGLGTIGHLVRRMLSKTPTERPTSQALIDALRGDGADVPLPPTVAAAFPIFDGAAMHRLLRDEEGVDLVLGGQSGSGRSRAASELAALAGLDGTLVVKLRGSGLDWEPAAGAFVGYPWRPIACIVAQLQRSGLSELELGRGDRLHAFERLTDAVRSAAAGRRCLIVWDDFEAAGPDARQWWHQFREGRGVGDRANFCTVTIAEQDAGPGVELMARRLGPDDWDIWRGATLRTEVRDIAAARWRQLRDQHAHSVGAMLRALDAEQSIPQGLSASLSRGLDTGGLVAVAADWRARAESLMQQCAYTEVIHTCRSLFTSWEGRSGPRAGEVVQGLLSTWTEAALRSGPDDSLDALEEALRGRLAEPWAAVLLGRLLHILGRHDDGLEALQSCDPKDPALAAQAHCSRAQLSLSSGQLDRAREHALRGLEHEDAAAPEVVDHLRLLAAAGSAIRGVPSGIETLQSLATTMERRGAPLVLRARLHAYLGIGLTRLDDLDAAADAHLKALELVELAGLDGELPTYLLNAGTAYHKQGRLGLAREYYARGVRVCRPSTRPSTRALLFANQANIDVSLGRLDEARDLVARAAQIARGQGSSAIEVMARSVEGDIELAAGNVRAALDTYREVISDPRLSLSEHQAVELDLAIAEAAIHAGDLTLARAHLESAQTAVTDTQHSDLEHRLGILRGLLQWVDGSEVGTMAGIELFRRNLVAAANAGDHKLVLRQAPPLLAKLLQEGLDELAEEITAVAEASRNAIATGLTKTLRREFFANLPPSPVLPERSRSSQTTPAAADVEPFYRMLSLNEVILHTTNLDDLLPRALEIAVALSGAERGFILLRADAPAPDRFRVVASRDVGGAPIPAPHLEVSLTIAEEAARTGRTVVTLNAREDARFNAALSVVDLDLTSVLCVPVRDASGLLGGLYLDHRFHPGAFAGEVPRMMESFGHQLALGINNSRRLAELAEERQLLAAAKEELATLLRERELALAGLEVRYAELAEQLERDQAAGLREIFPEIAFGSAAMEKVLGQVQRVARGDIPVVITGESGSGKELIARAIHDASPRSRGPFVALNCGAVTESLFESEMFGHVKGAFTGAQNDRQGLFMAAQGGTIFLDEIGEMPQSMQVKLLRVLQERAIRRVGASDSRPIDVRVVAATNRDLAGMVREDTFREDLFYRLAAFVIRLPPLRERPEDIPFIATRLLESISSEVGREVGLTPEAAHLLTRSDWPGNVRQLENVLRAAAVMGESPRIEPWDVAPLVSIAAGQAELSSPGERGRGRRPKATRFDVQQALDEAGGDRTLAAQALDVSERTLYRYIRKHRLF